MSYYTERHGMRTPVKKTDVITSDMYAILFDCCERYQINIAWKFPLNCPDGRGIYGIDVQRLNAVLKYDIPTLYRDYLGNICVPRRNYNYFEGAEFDGFAILDYIEFIANNVKDIIFSKYHDFFKHHDMTFGYGVNIFKQFQTDINAIFSKTGLQYTLIDEKIVERVVENSPLTAEIEKTISTVDEKGLQELLQEAIALYKTPNPTARQDSVEKIWDAFERLKTYYTSMDKKNSAAKIVNDISSKNPDFINLFDKEFKELTAIGNSFRIRHHETDKIDITDSRHYDYFFNRCLSLIALAIQYLKQEV